MKFKKFGALLLSAVLCIGMAAPAFAYEGDTAPVEEPVLPEVVEEEDAVTITDEETGALTTEDITTPAIPMAAGSSSSRWSASRVRLFIWSLTVMPRDSRPSTS